MIIKGSVSIELDLAQKGEVVVRVLIEDFVSIAKDVDALWSKLELGAVLKSYEYEDLQDDLRILNSIDDVLSYYMVASDHAMWRNAWRKYLR